MSRQERVMATARKTVRMMGGPTAAVLAAGLADILRFIKSPFDPYRPELHYMRGPGPKWHAKHGGAAVETRSAPSLFHVEA
jgi:hypothetical protein